MTNLSEYTKYIFILCIFYITCSSIFYNNTQSQFFKFLLLTRRFVSMKKLTLSLVACLGIGMVSLTQSAVARNVFDRTINEIRSIALPDDNGDFIKLEAPDTLAAGSYKLTLPAAKPTTGKVLQTDSYGDLSWVNSTAADLDDLTDVSITSPTTGDVLNYNVDTWENISISDFDFRGSDDPRDTELGRKKYTASDSGNVTVSSGTPTTQLLLLVPYKTENGTWRLRFNLSFSLSTAFSAGWHWVSIPGVTFSDSQAFTITNQTTDTAGVQAPTGQAIGNNGYAGTRLPIYGNGTTIYHRISADLELTGKPTWAD